MAADDGEVELGIRTSRPWWWGWDVREVVDVAFVVGGIDGGERLVLSRLGVPWRHLENWGSAILSRRKCLSVTVLTPRGIT